MFTTKSKKKRMMLWELTSVVFLIYDVITVVCSYYLSLMLRYDFNFHVMNNYAPVQVYKVYIFTMPTYVFITILVYCLMKMYYSIWRFAGIYEFFRILIANVITLIINIILVNALIFVSRGNLDKMMPISYFVFGSTFQFLSALFIRFIYKFISAIKTHNYKQKQIIISELKPVLIFGAGSAGKMMARDIFRNVELSERVVGFIDDDSGKIGRNIDGIPILGGRDDILAIVEKYKVQKIYVVIPSASKLAQKEILNICNESGCKVLCLPDMRKIYLEKISVSNMQEVQIEDLLGRATIKINNEEVFDFISDKVVLITGAGGSIGSELSRQCAANSPKQLILFDIYENGVYDVQLELREKYPELDLVVLIGSVRDTRRIFQVFEQYKPEIVYHAAAHKHVPLMEASPCEALKNNTIGTYKTAFAAMIYGTSRFVMISTDKAVNPTNVMGASKRMCEMIIQSFDAKIKAGKADTLPQLFTHWLKEDMGEKEIAERLSKCKTEFVAVRFGNVLGSNGSVIPIFKRQIQKGGPVTVTHPDIIRYFMTIPEAVSLVLQAGTYANGGEIFVLDMGEPMKIDTLARNLIKLSGYIPDVDIKIEYTGLRPGEKLFEEKLMNEEGLQKTENDLIHIGSPIPFDHDEFINKLDELMEIAYQNRHDIKEYINNVVGTYVKS